MATSPDRATPESSPGDAAWVEVDLDAVAANVRALRSHIGGEIRLMAVVKADGYGHGAVPVARVALQAGAQWLGVARVQEGLELRAAGIEAPVLVLGVVPDREAGEVVRAGLRAMVCTAESAEALAGAARRAGALARVHIKVDTGMGRLGVLPTDLEGFCRRVAGMEGLVVEGIFTHMASADSTDPAPTLRQIALFREALAASGRAGVRPALAHAANSAAAIAFPQARFDMVRIGLALYGLSPAPHLAGAVPLRPAMALRARAVLVKRVPAGTPLSYGGTYVTRRETTVATLPVGYADGYPRSLSGRAQVLMGGRRVPVAGRVCMDNIMVDVGDLPVKAGDEAVLFGPGLPVGEVAEWAGTITYEIVSGMRRRLPRRYLTAERAREPAPESLRGRLP